MALTVSLDYPLRQLDMPGYWREMVSREVSNAGEPWQDSNEWQSLWADPATNTLMLRPLQLDKSFLDSEQQLDSIIRLADMQVNSSDLSNKRVYEAAAFGNSNSPWIFHDPIHPAGWSAGQVVAGVAMPILRSLLEGTISSGRSLIYTNPDTVPSSPPVPTQIGDVNDGKFLFHTKSRLAANQALYIRFWAIQSQVGFPISYTFYLGQFAVSIRDVMVEVWQDTSPHGDRSAWKKVMVKPLFSFDSFSTTGLKTAWLTLTKPSEILSHDRALLWIPYRRNQVLIVSSTGAAAVLQVNSKAKRLSDDSDWDITRESELVVWALSPSPGRVQIQRVKYDTVHLKTETPHFTLNYTPASPPTVALSADTDHASTITVTVSQPPAHEIATPNAEDCAAKTTNPSAISKQYGITLDFQGSSDGRWTPFFYRLKVTSPRTFKNSPATPTTVLSTSAGNSAWIKSAHIHAGQKPGDGRLTVKLLDSNTFPLANFYFRHTMPIQLLESGTPIFTGITEPSEVIPIRDGSFPRELTFSALDLWVLAVHTFFDQNSGRDYTGTGHMSAIKDVVELCGYDTATYGMDTPAFTVGNDTPLGLGSAQPVGQTDKTHRPGWQPDTGEKASNFMGRIAEKFSGWSIGWHANGQFFYHPKDFYTAVSHTFSAVRSGSSPYFYDLTLRPIQPEANVLAVIGGDDKTGDLRKSAYFIDQAAISNPLAVNYMSGQVRIEIPQLTGSYSCRELNYIARRMFDAARRRHITAEWTGDFIPGIQVGQVVTVGSHGNYRLTEYDADFVHGVWAPTKYVGELVESGIGV